MQSPKYICNPTKGLLYEYTQLDPEKRVMSAWNTYTLPSRILAFPLTLQTEEKKKK